MRMRPIVIVSLLFVTMATVRPASGIVIDLDYTHDTYISTNAAARAALEAAAADISAAITSSLSAITNDDDPIIGSEGGTTATFDWRFNFKNPATGANTIFDPPIVTADTVIIFAGARSLTGITLGIGSPNGAAFSLAGSGSPSEWISAVTDAEAQSNAIHSRGGGPTNGSFSGSSTLGNTTASYDLVYGSAIGSVSFDVDSDDDGGQDTATELADYWHFDHTSPVAAGKNDFYSVALHELLHVLGIGTNESWNDLTSGTTWTGSEAIALNGGSGAGLIASNGGHITDGLMSSRISDGLMQEVLMDPSITVGTRKALTHMDLAFLRDIGWQTIPEPGTSMVVLLGAVPILLRRRTNRRAH